MGMGGTEPSRYAPYMRYSGLCSYIDEYYI
jgi:hypothetical protein